MLDGVTIDDPCFDLRRLGRRGRPRHRPAPADHAERAPPSSAPGCTVGPGCFLADVDGRRRRDHRLVAPGRLPRRPRLHRGARSPTCGPAPSSAAGAKAGSFVEIKASRVGKGSKVPHLSYVGDTTIGEDTNIGAGTITANYDGERKYPTHIGSDVKVGSDTVFVAPVTDRRRRLHRRRLDDHQRRSRGRPGRGSRPPGERRGLREPAAARRRPRRARGHA